MLRAYHDKSSDRRELLGSVEASGEKAAIAAAIEKYSITDPERQKRLLAQRSG